MESELQRIRRANTVRRMPRVRQRVGKYRIERVIGEGGFATVYKARDTIEGIQVALKVLRTNVVDTQILDVFRQEARLHAKLDHPNILSIKDANVIDGHLVIVTRIGEGTLADRMSKRMALRTALHFAEEQTWFEFSIGEHTPADLRHLKANHFIHKRSSCLKSVGCRVDVGFD